MTRVLSRRTPRSPAVAWTARTRTDIDNTDPANPVATVVALDNDIKNEAVPWADGKTLGLGLGTGTLVSTDEFTLRGTSPCAAAGWEGQMALGGWLSRTNADGANPPILGIADPRAWRNWNAAYESSIQMKADGSGITLKMGRRRHHLLRFRAAQRAGRHRRP